MMRPNKRAKKDVRKELAEAGPGPGGAVAVLRAPAPAASIAHGPVVENRPKTPSTAEEVNPAIADIAVELGEGD